LGKLNDEVLQKKPLAKKGDGAALIVCVQKKASKSNEDKLTKKTRKE
jgi:hypothetical protein